MLTRNSILALSLVGAAALCSNVSCGGGGGGFADSGSDAPTGAGGASSDGGGAGGGTFFGGSGGTGLGGSGQFDSGLGGTANGGSASGGSALGGSALGGSAAGGTAAGGTAAGGTTATGCAYTGTAAAGAIATMPGMVGGYQSTVGLGGYSYVFDDGVAPIGTGMCAATTMADGPCIDTSAVCVSGTTGIASTSSPYNCYGGGFGMNVATATSGGTNATTSGTGTGVSYTLTGFPTIPGGGMRIQVTVGGMTYCAPITAAMDTIPWTSFEIDCYDATPGAALPGAPTSLSQVAFTIDDGTAATAYDICITALSIGG